jgi:hypothetical protein
VSRPGGPAKATNANDVFRASHARSIALPFVEQEGGQGNSFSNDHVRPRRALPLTIEALVPHGRLSCEPIKEFFSTDYVPVGADCVLGR